MAFEFASPGAEFVKALQQEMMLRQQLERQARQDEIEQQKLGMSQRELEESIRRGKDADTRADAADARAADAQDYNKVRDVVEDAGENTQISLDDPMAAKLKKHRPDRVAREEQATQGAQIGVTEDDIPLYDVAPGVMQVRPGFKWEQARAVEESRKEAAQIAAQARAEALQAQIAERTARSEDTLALRRELAGVQAGLGAQRNDIAQQGMDLRRETADAKTAEAEEAKENSRASMEDYGNSLMRNASDLIDPTKITLPKGKSFEDLTDADIKKLTPQQLQAISKSTLNATTGYVEGRPFLGGVLAGVTGRGEERELGKAAINNLKGMLTIDQLLELKRQSRTGATGFGALSERELSVIENAASRLNATTLTGEEYAREVLRIYAAAARSRAKAQLKPGADLGSDF